jgi:propionate CoA-transferase
MGKFVSADQAAKMIPDGANVATGGFVGTGVPEAVHDAVERRFEAEGAPTGLTLIYAAGQGDGGSKGLNHYGREGMLSRVIGGHWGLCPILGKLATEGKIQGYNLPQGVISHLFRDIAAGKPGTLTHVGLGTFVDPEQDGGKVNSITTEDIVHRQKINGKDYLFYDAHPIDVAIVRGTSADQNGNISMEKESLTIEGLALAMAARNSGGIVIVQVEKRVKNGSIDPKLVQIPGILVDAIVVVDDITQHMQSYGEQFNEAYVSNDILLDADNAPFPLNERKVIARRSAMLLNRDKRVLNYGIGMPEGIAQVLAEEGVESYFTPTVEPGAIGGTPAGGLSFGCAISPECIVDQPYQFDFYQGGGLDIAFLGLAQCDAKGNINVSRFGPKIAGCGGFIDITQNAKEVVFCGTFTAGGLKLEVKNGKLNILKEGKFPKFLKQVEQITFSGSLAKAIGKKVTYVTERAVFELGQDGGLVLTEIAPGVELEKDVLALMEFKPEVSENLKVMDWHIFRDEPLGLEIK